MEHEASISGDIVEVNAAHRAVYVTLADFLQSYHIWLYVSDRQAPHLNVAHAKEQMLAYRQRWLETEATYVERLQRSAMHVPSLAARPSAWNSD